MLYLAPGVATFGSKRGNVLTRFRELAEAIHAHLGVRNAILDGEVVALDDEGRLDFSLLLRSQGRLLWSIIGLRLIVFLVIAILKLLPLCSRSMPLD
jgi:hypothetical protein